MTVENEEIYPSAHAADDTPGVGARDRSWRRIVGGIIMVLGALLIAGFVALFMVVALTFVEWRNAVDGLTSVAMVCVAPIMVGMGLVAGGRWIHGGWRTHTPIALGVSIVFPILGVIAAFIAIAMFFWVLFAETGRGGAWALSQFVLSILASLTIVGIGVAVRPGRSKA